MSLIERLKRLLGGDPSRGGNGADGACPSSLSCVEAMEKLQEYLDGELKDAPHEEVARHFEVCQRCYPHLRLEERFREVLQRSQKEERCPETVRTQVLELLSTEAGDGA